MVSLQEFEDFILPEAVASGGFGKGAELVGVKKDDTTGKDQFASTVLFVDVELKVDDVVTEIPLVGKFQCECAERREKFNSDFQFFNEVLVYKEIVPLLPQSVLDILPNFYYGKATLNDSPKEDAIIVENLVARGYLQSAERLFLDYDHCSLVFKTLGKFHGGSLHIKSKRHLKFANIISKLTETRWVKKLEEEQNYFFGENAKRGVIPLVKEGENTEIVSKFLDKLENVYDIMSEVLAVNEFSLLNHGDFCRNNMVFKYEEGRPVDLKIFDLATARYASPAVDISFFLFMNTTPEFRRRHLDEFLRTYLEALHSVAGSDSFSMDDLLSELKDKAVYGYIVTAFFIPIMLDPPKELDNNLKNLTLQERVKMNLVRGGDKATRILAENVKDLFSWGYLK